MAVPVFSRLNCSAFRRNAFQTEEGQGQGEANAKQSSPWMLTDVDLYRDHLFVEILGGRCLG